MLQSCDCQPLSPSVHPKDLECDFGHYHFELIRLFSSAPGATSVLEGISRAYFLPLVPTILACTFFFRELGWPVHASGVREFLR